MHHKFNRTELERVEVIAAGQSKWRARVSYFANLFGGTYVLQMLGLLLLLILPKALARAHVERTDAQTYAGKALRAMVSPPTLRAVRQDTLAVLALFGAALALYGRDWPLLFAALAARAFLVSIVNYVYHYDTPLDDVLYARNLRLPPLLSSLMLHFNLHGIHHRHPSLPWTALPDAFARESRGEYDASFVSATMTQLRGPRDVAAVYVERRMR
jgi:fatty acid desaturase